jgi:hypothetical protein
VARPSVSRWGCSEPEARAVGGSRWAERVPSAHASETRAVDGSGPPAYGYPPMARPEYVPSENARRRPRVARRVAAALVAAAFVMLAFGLATRLSGGTRADAAGVVSVPGVNGRISVVARAGGANPFLALAQPTGRRRIATGDLSVAVVALTAASLFFKRAGLGAGRRIRFETVFAFRRGPPTFSVAH